MGWKASMILIDSQGNDIPDVDVLKALGVAEFKKDGDWSLEKCIYPRDRSVSIGRINNTIIVCDDLQLVDSSMTPELATYEAMLSKLAAGGEVLSLACLSSVNYHGYSLVKGGNKLRYKQVNTDGSLSEFGDLVKQEIDIYDQSVERNGKTVWPASLKSDMDVFEEDQLMEEFTFGMAKRLIGLRIDEEEGADLFFKTPFTKYETIRWDLPDSLEDPKVLNKSKSVIVAIALVVLLAISYYIFFR
jgi:hypothetical protein